MNFNLMALKLLLVCFSRMTANVKERQRKTEADLGRGNKRRLERMEYTQRLSLR